MSFIRRAHYNSLNYFKFLTFRPDVVRFIPYDWFLIAFRLTFDWLWNFLKYKDFYKLNIILKLSFLTFRPDVVLHFGHNGVSSGKVIFFLVFARTANAANTLCNACSPYPREAAVNYQNANTKNLTFIFKTSNPNE